MICANVTLQQLGDNSPADIIKRNAGSYYLGSQGADLLYFRPLQLLRGKRSEIRLASKLHHQPVEKLALMGFKFLLATSTRQQFESTFAYVCGFVTHHAVDQRVHPMILGHTDSLLKHRRIELDFDTYVARKLDRMPTEKAWTGIDGFERFGDLSKWYNQMLYGLYRKELKVTAFKKAYKTMRRAASILNRPHRLEKSKYMNRALLSDSELNAMLMASLQGASDAAAMINRIFSQMQMPPAMPQFTVPLPVPLAVKPPVEIPVQA